MSLTERENYLRNVTMTGPEWMPIFIYLPEAIWYQLGSELDAILLRHPVLFPNHQPGRVPARPPDEYGLWETDEETVDQWGCRWHAALEGLVGLVKENPLDDWSKFDAYRMPDPADYTDWEATANRLREARAQGKVASGGLEHGFFFMRLYYLRGLENLMIDYASDEPRLQALIDGIVDYYREVVRRYVEIGVDVISGGDDLGTQAASLISPVMFRKWITPAYTKIFEPARAAGCQVYLHSDGHMVELMDELIAAGVTITNPQDLCNGLDAIKSAVGGRICVSLDIDRQRIMPFGSPREIKDHVAEAVCKLGSPRGGLELVVGIYPPTPPENIDALFTAFEEYRTWWFDGRK